MYMLQEWKMKIKLPSRVLTLSEYKRVDDDDTHGGKLELEWWREPTNKMDPELAKLKKKLIKSR